jgi:hypothetical protein
MSYFSVTWIITVSTWKTSCCVMYHQSAGTWSNNWREYSCIVWSSQKNSDCFPILHWRVGFEKDKGRVCFAVWFEYLNITQVNFWSRTPRSSIDSLTVSHMTFD